MIDEEKLTEFNELMGYYQIATSETEMDDLEIIDKYHGLTQIEDQFREMKGTLETRPIYVNTPEHIQAHLLICFITTLAKAGIDLKTIQRISGHANITTTLNIYTHTREEEIQAAGAKVGKLIGS